MIIHKGQSNTIVERLHDVISLSSDFLLELTNGFENKPILCSIVNISNFPEIYAEYIVVEPTDIELSPPGQWSFRILEMAAAVPPNMVAADAISACKVGICTVIGTEPEPVQFDLNDNDQNKVFDPQ